MLCLRYSEKPNGKIKPKIEKAINLFMPQCTLGVHFLRS